MAVYTCFDMIADCRKGKSEGWEYLVTQMLPAFRQILRRHAPAIADDTAFWKQFLKDFRQREDSPLQTIPPATEREFLFHIRDFLLKAAGDAVDGAEPYPDFESFVSTLEPFTVIEKQMIWLQTMGYGVDDTATLVRVFPETVEHALERASKTLAERLPSLSLVRDGPRLQRAARAAPSEEPIALRIFLEALDGRLTWDARLDFEARLNTSWHELDRFCRMREADAAIGAAAPLAPSDASVYLNSMGLAKSAKPPFWKRVFTS